MQVSYKIKDDSQEFKHGYGQTYPDMIKVNSELVTGIFNNRSRLGHSISEKIVDIIEKYGMVNLDKSFMEQDTEMNPPNQELIKLHLYHWLYDCVATLDAVACLLNLKFSVRENPKRVAMNLGFITELRKKSPHMGSLLSEEFCWIEQLKNMRDCIIHREGRLVVGGHTDPCVVIDFSRAFVKDLPLHRMRVPDLTEEYMARFDSFLERVLGEVSRWRSH